MSEWLLSELSPSPLPGIPRKSRYFFSRILTIYGYTSFRSTDYKNDNSWEFSALLSLRVVDVECCEELTVEHVASRCGLCGNT